MAQSCILQIPELVESILFHLDNRTLLHATRVSRNFEAIITTSPTLQRKLFFCPEPRRSAPTISLASSKVTSPDTFPLPFSSQNVLYAHLNPLLVDSFPIFFPENSECHGLMRLFGYREDFISLRWARDVATIAAYARSNASWRRMLVSNPPIRTAYVNTICSGIMLSSVQITRLNCGPDGLKMGLLYDFLQESIVAQDSDSFSIFWPSMAAVQENRKEDRYVVGTDGGELVLRIEISYVESCTFDGYDDDVVGKLSRLKSEGAEEIKLEILETFSENPPLSR
jgi:hypothetical protein